MMFSSNLLQQLITSQPLIARGIHYRNKGLLSNTYEHNLRSVHEINLCGVAIGNGWIDVKVQGPAAIDYAWYVVCGSTILLLSWIIGM